MNFFDISEITTDLTKNTRQQIAVAMRLQSSGQGVQATREYLSLLAVAKSSSLTVIIYNLLGIIFVEGGRHDKGIVCFEEALQVTLNKDDKAAQAKVLANIGTLYERESRWHEADQTYSKSLKLFEILGMSNEATTIQQALLDTRAAQSQAGVLFSESELQGRLTAAERLNRLGQLYLDIDDAITAVRNFKKAKKKAHEEGNFKLLNTILNNMALALKRQCKNDEARKCYQLAIEVCKKASDSRNHATTLNNLGVLLWETKDYKDAIRTFEESLKIKEKTAESRYNTNTLFNLAKLYFEIGDFLKAREIAIRARDIDKNSSPENLKQDENLLNEIELQISRVAKSKH